MNKQTAQILKAISLLGGAFSSFNLFKKSVEMNDAIKEAKRNDDFSYTTREVKSSDDKINANGVGLIASIVGIGVSDFLIKNSENQEQRNKRLQDISEALLSTDDEEYEEENVEKEEEN